MPELPEIETIRCTLLPLEGQLVSDVKVRERRLRWSINNLTPVINQYILSITRISKYLLINFYHGSLIIHLGMSGKILVLDRCLPPQKHDHVDFILQNAKILRYHDPRRFGCILWTTKPNQHKLLINLGVEPLTKALSGKFLYQILQGKTSLIKTFLMNAKYIVGIGNIYANEVLFKAKIHPLRIARTLTLNECISLCKAIKTILLKAIKAGGTTIKDFKNANNSIGYFAQQLQVYGKNNESCSICSTPISLYRLSGRSTYWCDKCQILN